MVEHFSLYRRCFPNQVLSNLLLISRDGAVLLNFIFLNFSTYSRRQRVIIRNRAERVSELLDWKTLGGLYREARRMALKKIYPDLEMRTSELLAKNATSFIRFEYTSS
uniref:Glycogen [starch] synthase n=1 Tax=Meloidogyne incognita TaxID=6306 RepID=A0A914LNL0_MELIC